MFSLIALLISWVKNLFKADQAEEEAILFPVRPVTIREEMQ